MVEKVLVVFCCETQRGAKCLVAEERRASVEVEVSERENERGVVRAERRRRTGLATDDITAGRGTAARLSKGSGSGQLQTTRQEETRMLGWKKKKGRCREKGTRERRK